METLSWKKRQLEKKKFVFFTGHIAEQLRCLIYSRFFLYSPSFFFFALLLPRYDALVYRQINLGGRGRELERERSKRKRFTGGHINLRDIFDVSSEDLLGNMKI